jgi:hypothetical protein
MVTAFWSSRLRRGVMLSVVTLAGVLAMAPDARGVILYSTPVRNTTPPSVADGLDAWNLEAQWDNYLATPIDATHFIAAKHVGFASSTITFVYQGGTLTYPVDSSSERTDPYSDLAIFSLQSGYAFPAYAPLYSAAVDGSDVGKTMTVIGRGTTRGGAVVVDNATKGWTWGNADGLQSWGQNVVSGLADYSSNPASQNALLYFDFDSNGIPNEAALSVGDSSGAVFIYSHGQWKLAGINYAIDSPWSDTGAPGDPGFIADVFDARGLYYKDQNNNWALVPPDLGDPVPGAGYASDISQRLGWIEATIPSLLPGDANGDGIVNGADLNIVLSNYGQTGMDWAQGDFNGDGAVNGADLNVMLSNYNRSISLSAGVAVPEPGAMAMLGSGGALLLLGLGSWVLGQRVGYASA